MKIIRLPRQMTAWSNSLIRRGKRIALVPTMGYFHEGHLRLMRLARQHADHVVVSLFVNPIQFGPREDLASYPRDLERDAELAEGEQVDVLFVPEAGDMYPEGAQTRVTVSALSEGLCGRSRPGHFAGVATVVAKLFHIVKPQVAVFGEKDFQQLAVIRQMATDLNWDIDIVGHPIVREPDGLAMSSRNTYLSPAERLSALCLFQAIQHARQRVRQGLREADKLLSELDGLVRADAAVEPEYIAIVHRQSLVPQALLDRDSVLALAVRVGKTRLIDNDLLFADRGVP